MVGESLDAGITVIVFDTPSPRKPPQISAYRPTLYCYELQSWVYILPLIVWVYLRWNFSGGLHETSYFCKSEWRFGFSRSSKVIDFGTNRKRTCDFLLVRHSNLGPILHHFGDTAGLLCSWPHPYSVLFLGCSRLPVGRGRCLWGQFQQVP